MAAPLKATFFAFRRRERGGVPLRATLVLAFLSAGVNARAAAAAIADGRLDGATEDVAEVFA